MTYGEFYTSLQKCDSTKVPDTPEGSLKAWQLFLLFTAGKIEYEKRLKAKELVSESC